MPFVAQNLRHLPLHEVVRSAVRSEPVVEIIGPLRAVRPIALLDHRVFAHVQEFQIERGPNHQEDRRRRDSLGDHLGTFKLSS